MFPTIFWSSVSALLRPQALTDDGDVKSTDQTHGPLLASCRLSGYQKQKQQHNYKPQEITARAKNNFNNLRLSAARVRFAQSKFSFCPSTAARKKRVKTCCSNQIPRWRAYERNVHVVNVGKATTLDWEQALYFSPRLVTRFAQNPAFASLGYKAPVMQAI